MKTVLFAAALLCIGGAHAHAQTDDAYSCASWNYYHDNGKGTESIFQNVWINGYIAALSEMWIVDGTHDVAAYVPMEKQAVAVSQYCHQHPSGILSVAARNAAEMIYPRTAKADQYGFPRKQ